MSQALAWCFSARFVSPFSHGRQPNVGAPASMENSCCRKRPFLFAQVEVLSAHTGWGSGCDPSGCSEPLGELNQGEMTVARVEPSQPS